MDKNLAVLTTAVVSSFLIAVKAQFNINIVPEVNDFFVVLIALGFAIYGILRNNREEKKK